MKLILNGEVTSKLKLLKNNLQDMGKILIAFSKGVDSSLLLKIASTQDINIIAATAFSDIFPGIETKLANQLTKKIRH